MSKHSLNFSGNNTEIIVGKINKTVFNSLEVEKWNQTQNPMLFPPIMFIFMNFTKYCEANMNYWKDSVLHEFGMEMIRKVGAFRDSQHFFL